MKVVVALDDTENASQVVDAVAKSHWPVDTEIKLLTVLEPLHWEAIPCLEWNERASAFHKEMSRKAHEVVLRARSAIIKAHPEYIIHVEVREGDAKEQIIDAATQWMADRIVLGAHGHAPNRFFKGSVARSVSRYCACSIQLVRLKKFATN